MTFTSQMILNTVFVGMPRQRVMCTSIKSSRSHPARWPHCVGARAKTAPAADEHVPFPTLTANFRYDGRDTPRLSQEELAAHLPALPAWQLDTGGAALRRSLVAKNFVAAVDFVNSVRDVAESEGHHPDLHITDYRCVEVVLTTHSIGGLSMRDVILAAKIDAIRVDYSPKWLKAQADTP